GRCAPWADWAIIYRHYSSSKSYSTSTSVFDFRLGSQGLTSTSSQTRCRPNLAVILALVCSPRCWGALTGLRELHQVL
ncbi:hypothetical protein TGAM01_v208461, partial [Trichoderma gamsii]